MFCINKTDFYSIQPSEKQRLFPFPGK